MFWHPPQGARRRAVRWRHPSSWSRCRSGEVPDRSARCLKKGGSPAMFHRPALLKSTCTKRVEVSQTPTLILEEEKDKGTAKQKPQFGHRDGRGVMPCDRCCNPWVSCLLLPPPIQQPTRPRYPQRYTEGETLLREYLGPSTATKADSKCCVETITATLSAVY